MAKFTSKTRSNEAAIHGESRDGNGGFFHSDNREAVFGQANSTGTAAIAGIHLNANSAGAGVYGEHKGSGAGVVGVNNVNGPGGFFHSETREGIFAQSKSPGIAAIAGIQQNPTSTGAGIYGEHIAGLTAGFFRGNVIITGDLSFPGADCAEDFTIKEDVLADPGTVMALSETGELVPCAAPYERKVAGVIAGAGSLRPGIVMDKQESSAERRQPIALVGKVFCKVDASYGAIKVGDLLTSSATQGHAMKAHDPARAFGAVIGKAMAPLHEGRGLIPILISLQ
jgi:hypothetical protein